MRKSNKPRIALIANPFFDIRGTSHVLTLVRILEPLSDKIYLITGASLDRSSEKIQMIKVSYSRESPLLIRFLRSMMLRPLRISFHLCHISRSIDTVIFFTGTLYHWLPTLTAKVLGKWVILVAVGSESKSAREDYRQRPFGYGGTIIYYIFRLGEKINFFLANEIVVETPTSIQWLGISKKQMHKISLSEGELPIDINRFRIERPHEAREIVIGYIGALIEGKGVMSFAAAIPLIMKRREDVTFLIGGDGYLFNKIKQVLMNNGSLDKVALAGWIPGEQLPDYLNRLRLFVYPSYTAAGIPVGILEAMACGTTVLATAVGGIPDGIKDKETGFIMEDNSPECIARNVIRALECPKVDEIVKNARSLVEEKYTYEAVVKRYRSILCGGE